MGCLSSRHHKSIQSPPLQQHYPSFQKKISSRSSCSTLGSLSEKSLRDKIIHRASTLQKVHILYSKDFQNDRGSIYSLTMKNLSKSVGGPEINSQNFEVSTNIENMAIELQMLHGYPYENMVFFVSQNTNPQLPEFQNDIRFFLKDNISIYAKFFLTCPKCLGKTLYTSSKTLFTIQSINCCCFPEYLILQLSALSPINGKVWASYQQQEIYPILINQKYRIAFRTKIRVIGCSNCWKFSTLSLRGCGCAACDQCRSDPCQICDIRLMQF